MILHDEREARAFVASRSANAAIITDLERLHDLLIHEGRMQNLVAASTLENVWIRHFADSAQLIDHVSRGTSPWLDLGSGAGFPGIVVAMMSPETKFVLIESRKLRIQWLERVIEMFHLGNCRVLGMDVRHAATIEAGVISARAFAPLPRLIELSARFSTIATQWVLPKGRSAEQDIAMLPNALQSRFHVKQSVTDPEARIVVAKGKLEPIR